MRIQGCRRRMGLGALAGLLAAGAALGAGQFLAGLTGASGSPVVAVGQLMIDLTPPAVKDFAVTTFGSHDKPVLVGGIVVVLAAFAALAGAAATRRTAYGLAGLAALAAVGLTAAATRPDASVASVLPTLGATAAAAVVLLILVPLIPAAAPAGPGYLGERPANPGAPRRSFLVGGGAAAVFAAGSGLAGRLLADQASVAGARKALPLRRPQAATAAALPGGADLRIPGLPPFVTPVASFYRVDTAIVLPQVDPASWQLRVHGMVSREIVLSLHDLLRRPLTEHYITLCCVSNPVGGPYIGNARWLGASLAGVLREAGIKAGADQLLCTSADGFTSGTPVQAVMDGRDALLAVAMNGRALPVAHGFPARMVVPGLYGYVSATKWVTDINVTTFARSRAYWAQRGWAQRAPIKTECRIDVPNGLNDLAAGRTAVAGVAWAQHKGIDAVHVRVDRGPWTPARLAAVPGIDTWRQWVWEWDAAPGRHVLEARATDATGYTQTSLAAQPEPDGASGYPMVSVTVRSPRRAAAGAPRPSGPARRASPPRLLP